MEIIQKKKLVFITARLPYPASSGRKNVMYNYCKILHDIYSYDITVISFLENGDNINPKPDFINSIITLPNVGGKRKILNLLRDTLILKRFPMQVSLYLEPKHQEKIDKVLKEISPDIVMTDMVRTTEYARKYNGYKIADLDDMLSIRYERQLNMDLSSVNPYGAYLYSLPPILQSILAIKWIKKFILKNEILLLKKYELEVAQAYERTIFVAQREADLLNDQLNFNRAIGIPLGVDLDYFGEYFGKIEAKKHTIVFLGAMSVAHNEAGAIHFIEEILPLVVKQLPDAKFVIVGGGITEKLKSVATEYVEFTGRVDDVRNYVGKCEVFVCPLTFGSGIKTKNLEAMAMGVPVVTTTIGAENINAVDGQDWIVADEKEDFADAIVKIMTDEKLANDLKTNAFNFVKNNFTWKIAEGRFKEVLGE